MQTGDRVQTHPTTDMWMRGARFGTVVAIEQDGTVRVALDRLEGIITRFEREDVIAL
jgi:hypothetical protein